MYKELDIDGKSVPMLCNAATPIRFKGVFHRDLLKFLTSMSTDGVDQMEIAYAMQELAYGMNAQAEKKDFTKLNEDTYMAWLEEFENPMAIVLSADKIMNVYQGQTVNESKPKK